jgi:hypothetical protein
MSWIQLIGDHEWHYLDDAVFWPEPLGDGEVATLRTWWMREWVRVAAAVRTAEGEEFLLTHAGLTTASWQALDGPVTAATAADLLNIRPEELLRDYDGPLWAAARSQLHPCGERLRERTEVDGEARHTVTRIGGSRFVGADPNHGTTGAPAWTPWSSKVRRCFRAGRGPARRPQGEQALYPGAGAGGARSAAGVADHAEQRFASGRVHCHRAGMGAGDVRERGAAADAAVTPGWIQVARRDQAVRLRRTASTPAFIASRKIASPNWKP